MNKDSIEDNFKNTILSIFSKLEFDSTKDIKLEKINNSNKKRLKLGNNKIKKREKVEKKNEKLEKNNQKFKVERNLFGRKKPIKKLKKTKKTKKNKLYSKLREIFSVEKSNKKIIFIQVELNISKLKKIKFIYFSMVIF